MQRTRERNWKMQLLALKVEEEATGPGMQVPPEGEEEGKGFFPEACRRNTALLTL